MFNGSKAPVLIAVEHQFYGSEALVFMGVRHQFFWE